MSKTPVDVDEAYKEIVSALGGNLQTGMCCCPSHPDEHPSLSIGKMNGILSVRCYAGCEREDVIAALIEAEVWPYGEDSLTLSQYADAKKIPMEFLKQISLSDIHYMSKPAVRIPYKDTNGRDSATRFRLRLSKSSSGDDRFRWKKGSKTSLYGLDRLPEARSKGYVVVVEGESDAQTLWYRGEPSIGVPGAEMMKEEWFTHFEGIPTIYLVREPDQGGDALLQSFVKSSLRERLKVVELGDHKDPSGLYLADPEHFCDRWQTALDDAKLLSELAIAVHKDQVPSSSTKSALDTLVNLGDLQPEKIEWLWESRIPFGQITLLDGDPGLGKTSLAIHIAARLSKGEGIEFKPLFTQPKMATLILTAEDHLANTIRPRIEAAGGDPSLFYSLPFVVDSPSFDGESIERPLTLPQDVDMLREVIEDKQIRFVIIDPLMAYLSGEVDSYKDQHVRRALYPLVKLAAETNVAILIIRHLNKTPGNSAIYRGGGSIAFTGAARSVMLMAKDPENEAYRILAPVKCNLCKLPIALQFRLEAASADEPACVVWMNTSGLSADALLAPPRQRTSVVDQAEEFLRSYLAGGAKPSREVAEAARQVGISKSALDRARQALRTRVYREGMQWMTALEVPTNG